MEDSENTPDPTGPEPQQTNAVYNGLRITNEIQQYWITTTKWTRFFAVLFFIVLGLIGIFFLVSLAFLSKGIPGVLLVLFVGAYGAAIYFIAQYYLRFSNRLRDGVYYDRASNVEDAFTNLNNLYRLIGWITIVGLGMYLLLILFAGSLTSYFLHNQ
jgi:hypothetical protein